MIWLIGAKGMLASEIALQMKQAGVAFIGTDAEVDITDRNALFAFTDEHAGIDWIINCAAYTAVDRQEDDAERAELLNASGPSNIAEAAKRCGARFIHISTDYVFDGSGSVPYTEDMPVCPASVYGRTKAHGEANVRAILPDHSWIIRTAWLYGFDGKNFVYTMTRIFNEKEKAQVVDDQKGTPTFAGDLARAILTLVEKVSESEASIAPGIYHFSNLGEITWYDFACAIYKLGKHYGRITSDCRIEPCTSAVFIQKANRPAYSVLSKDKITQSLGIQIPEWQDSLEFFMKSDRFQNV